MHNSSKSAGRSKKMPVIEVSSSPSLLRLYELRLAAVCVFWWRHKLICSTSLVYPFGWSSLVCDDAASSFTWARTGTCVIPSVPSCSSNHAAWPQAVPASRLSSAFPISFHDSSRHTTSCTSL